MIIECPACRSRFRLDETKIKGRGARVRCRRCGESIVVMRPEEKPAAPPPETMPGSLDLAAAIRESAAGPLEAAAPPVPEAPLVAPAKSGPAPEPAAPARGFRPEEPAEPAVSAEAPPEREFSLETAPHAPEPEPAVSEPAFRAGEPLEPAPAPEGAPDEVDLAFARLLAQAAEAEPSADERELPEGERATAHEAPETPLAAPVAESEAAPGAVPEVPELLASQGGEPRFEPEEPVAILSAEPIVPAAKEPPAYEIVHGFEGSLRAEPPPGAEPGEPPAKPVGFELTEEAPLFEGKRELYDISGTLQVRPAAGPDADREPAPAPLDEKTRAEDYQEELMAIRERGPVPAVEGAVARAPEPPLLAVTPLPARPETPVAAGAAAGRPFVRGLIALFLVLAAGGAWLGFTPGGQETLRALLTRSESLLPGKQKGPQSAYNFANVIGYYESGAQSGRLFVIKGQVTNASRARKHGIQVVAALLDPKGQPLAQQTVYAGTALTGDFLRQSSREKIEAELSNPIGRNLQNIDIPPGKTVPFTAVFFGAPDGIDAYRLEAKDGE